ncbi:WD40-repeat-containing domain protein [Podospora didyma]|uniref:WD40-repeat-containing domain protein n=1 Tax=Podospora didyma TaxID=330526 RepID=A0AAE0P5N0_9PEZI|nr:WD40-repeat-containing domain protein [Podospora didyma]
MPDQAGMVEKKEYVVARLQNNYVLSPITALAFCTVQSGRVLVLAGEDTWLKVYDVGSTRLLGQIKVFYTEPIHGIHVSQAGELSDEDTRVLIWGGQSVTTLSRDSLQALIDGKILPRPNEFQAPEWIYDGVLFPSDSINGALVTAHNEIVPISASADGQSLTFGSLTSPSRPILYSANLCLLSPDSILVVGGTVFGEVIVWKYFLNPTASSKWELLYVFTGHEGSIFGVSISPEIEIAPNAKVRLLASCSDDRTVRIWDITDRSFTSQGNREAHSKTLAEARETGFGGNSEVKSENNNDSARCLAVAMGHGSRIWHVKFTGRKTHHSPQGTSPIEVHSFGEDCTRQKWDLTFNPAKWQSELSRVPSTESNEAGMIGTLKLRNAMSAHSGKNIWSAAVFGDSFPTIVSGGADGKIAISGDESEAMNPFSGKVGDSYSDLDVSLSFGDVIQSLPVGANAASPDPLPKSRAKDGFHRYSFISKHTILATTASGRVLLAALGNSLAWEEIPLSQFILTDLNSFSTVISPAPGLALIGSASGKTYLFEKPRGIREIGDLGAKISNFVCVLGRAQDLADDKRPKSWTVVVTALGFDHARILTCDAETGDATMDPRPVKLKEHYIATSASVCGGRLILGSRVGALTVFRPGADCFTPELYRKDCKTKDAVTCIAPLPGSCNSFLTCCRDGIYRIYSIDSSGADVKLYLQHEISPPMGMLEGAWFSTPTADNKDIELIIYGFRGQHFVVWNESSQQELATVECGGGHRPFDYMSPQTDPGQMRFVFTKAAHMKLHSQRRPALRALKEGGHGREIRAAASCDDHKFVATAAEDTNIRIWQYRDNQTSPVSRGFKCLAIIEKHTAGIQCLKWHGSSYLLSSAGSEEFFIWRITRLDSDYETLAVVCEAVYPDRTADGDLRILDFDVQAWDDSTMLISLALSNSTLKTYLYSEDQGFKLVTTGHYTGACLTQIRHLQAAEGGPIHVLTASTDGHIAIWAATPPSTSGPGQDIRGYSEYSIVLLTKINQSSVKSLAMSHGSSSSDSRRWLVVTGGDDNALGVLDLSWSSSTNTYMVCSRSRVKDAHSAAITGLCTIKQRNSDGLVEELDGAVEVATASNDQRVKLWRIERNGSGVAVKMLDNQYSSVADPGDLEVVAPGRLMVGGVGMEVWDVLQKERIGA